MVAFSPSSASSRPTPSPLPHTAGPGGSRPACATPSARAGAVELSLRRSAAPGARRASFEADYEVPADDSGVNIFRTVFREYFGADLPAVPDQFSLVLDDWHRAITSASLRNLGEMRRTRFISQTFVA